MTGELDLTTLTAQMAPVLHDTVYVFCSFADGRLPPGLTPVCTFAELEGLSAILPQADAQREGIDGLFESRMITLTIHSSLEAVGFLAVLTTRLAEAGIPCNVVSAFHHDHLFVPADQALAAFDLLVFHQHKPDPAAAPRPK